MPPGNLSGMTSKERLLLASWWRPAHPGKMNFHSIHPFRGAAALTSVVATTRAIRGRLLTFLRAPQGTGDTQSYRYIDDGIVLVKDGRVELTGPADEISSSACPPALQSTAMPAR